CLRREVITRLKWPPGSGRGSGCCARGPKKQKPPGTNRRLPRSRRCIAMATIAKLASAEHHSSRSTVCTDCGLEYVHEPERRSVATPRGSVEVRLCSTCAYLLDE